MAVSYDEDIIKRCRTLESMARNVRQHFIIHLFQGAFLIDIDQYGAVILL